MGYLYLSLAIVLEVIATLSLKSSNQFTEFWPSVIVALGYLSAFYFLSLVLKTIPVGIAYAIWAGAGIALVAMISAVLFKQIPDVPAVIGMLFIVAGVVIINVFSKTSVH
jgi:small multidrug resistance pump